MTFYYPGSYSFNPGSYDDIFNNPRDYHRGSYPYQPNLSSVPSQNVDLNCCYTPSWDVPYPSFHGPSYHQLPYANHTVLRDQWTDSYDDRAYLAACAHSELVNKSMQQCYNVITSSTPPQSVYPSVLQHDCEYAEVNQPCRAVNDSSCVLTAAVAASLCQHPPNPYPFHRQQNLTHPNGTQNYCIDDMMVNTMVLPDNVTGEDRNTGGIQFCLDDENNTHSQCFPCVSQHYSLTNTRADTSSISDYSTENTYIKNNESISHQMSSLPRTCTRRTLVTDPSIYGGACTGYAHCNSSMIPSYLSHHETVSTNVSTTTQCIPSRPQSTQEQVTPCSQSTMVQSTCSSGFLTQMLIDDAVNTCSTVWYGNEQSHTDNSKTTLTVTNQSCPIPSELNISSRHIPSSADVTEPAECCDTVFKPSDDVIVLSPSSPVVVNFQSVLHDDAVNSLLDTGESSKSTTVMLPPHVSRHTVEALHCHSLPSVPLTCDFIQSRNDCVLPSHTSNVINHCCRLQTTPLCHHVVSCIAADTASMSCVKPVYCQPSVTVSCNHLTQVHQHAAQIQQLRLTQASSLTIPTTCNPAVNSNNCYGANNSQHTGMQKSILRSSAFPPRGIAQHNARGCVTRAVNVRYISALSQAVTASTKSSQSASSLPVHRHASCTLHRQAVSQRRNGTTYSMKAARLLLLRLRRAKLSDMMAPRHHSTDVIDLTADDDDEEKEEEETCERIFARTRRHAARIHRPRQNYTRTTVVDGIFHNPTCRPMKKTFPVDRSLPFYRCFVRKLLRNYRFTASGLPVKTYPQIMPPSPPCVHFAHRGARSPGSDIVYKDLVKKRQPIVLVRRLDQSILNKYVSVNFETLQCDAKSHRTEDEVHRALSVSSNTSANLQSFESHRPQDTARQKITVFDDTDRGSVSDGQMKQRIDELLSLCRPVSVVLQRLDRITLRHTELAGTEAGCHGNEKMAQMTDDSAEADLIWTVIEIPRANKVPLLVLRALSAQKKVTDKTDVCPTSQRRSTLKRLRTRHCNIGFKRHNNFPPDSVDQRTLRRRTLHASSSVSMSLRSRNIGRVHYRSWARLMRPRCQGSSKFSHKQSKTTFPPREIPQRNADRKLCSQSTQLSLHAQNSVENDLRIVPSNLNSLVTDSSGRGSDVNNSLPEDNASSGSDMVILSPHAASVEHDPHSLTTGLCPQNTDLLAEDCASLTSNAVVLPPLSSDDDLTIDYRSPISTAFDLDDCQEREQEGNMEEGNTCTQ